MIFICAGVLIGGLIGTTIGFYNNADEPAIHLSAYAIKGGIDGAWLGLVGGAIAAGIIRLVMIRKAGGSVLSFLFATNYKAAEQVKKAAEQPYPFGGTVADQEKAKAAGESANDK